MIDVLTVFHNSERFVEPYFEGLGAIGAPFTLYLLDNDSSDHTADRVGRALESGPAGRFYRSPSNRGFSAGVNQLARLGASEYIFILNPDARPEPGCVERLLERMASDDRIAIAESRQAPSAHPKSFDPATGDTSWCSGAAALIRRSAFNQVGGFDEKLFFMYCEDVDLSWKLWLSGWRCVHVPNAVVHHPAGPARGGRRPLERYFSFRNSLFLYHRFRGAGEGPLPVSFLLNRFASRRYSLKSKALFAIAFADHIRYIPYLFKTRREWGNRGHPWVRLSETSLAD